MPREKKPQQFYGLFRPLLPVIHSYTEQRKFDFAFPSNPAARHPFSQPSGKAPQYLVPLQDEELMVLIRVSLHPEKCLKEWQELKILYTKWPDEIPEILTFIRRTVASWKQNQSRFVEMFLRTHSIATNPDGKTVPVQSLLDKELAEILERESGLAVNAASVKKARQKIAKQDEKQAYWESPEGQQQLQHGKTASRKKRVRRKGKK